MAELTEEQKIIIGVCVGVAGLILIAIIIFICCIFYIKEKRRRRNGYKDELIDNRYDRYPVYEKEVPPMIYDPPPPPPPPPPMWKEPVYYKRPRSIDYPYRHEERYSEPPRMKYEERYTEPPRMKYRESRWDGQYRNDPIVVPIAEPEYMSSRAPRREPDTIYLKYVDDQALLPRTNYTRRSDYGPTYAGGGLRRSRSFNDMRASRGGNAYTGEWGRRPEYPSKFNEGAYQDGRDPFLWN